MEDITNNKRKLNWEETFLWTMGMLVLAGGLIKAGTAISANYPLNLLALELVVDLVAAAFGAFLMNTAVCIRNKSLDRNLRYDHRATFIWATGILLILTGAAHIVCSGATHTQAEIYSGSCMAVAGLFIAYMSTRLR